MCEYLSSPDFTNSGYKVHDKIRRLSIFCVRGFRTSTQTQIKLGEGGENGNGMVGNMVYIEGKLRCVNKRPLYY